MRGMSLFAYFQTTDPDFEPIAAHRRALGGESVTYEVDLEGPDVPVARRAAARRRRGDPGRHRRRLRRDRAQARRGGAAALGRAAEARRSTRPRTRSSSWTPPARSCTSTAASWISGGSPRKSSRAATTTRPGLRARPARGARRLRQEGHERLRAAGRRQPRRGRAEGRAAHRARFAAAGRRRPHGRARVELPRRDRAQAGRGGHRADALAAQGDASRRRATESSSSTTGGTHRQLQPEVRGDVAHPRRRHGVARRQAGDGLRARPAARPRALRPEGEGPLRRSPRPRATTGSTSRTGAMFERYSSPQKVGGPHGRPRLELPRRDAASA